MNEQDCMPGECTNDPVYKEPYKVPPLSEDEVVYR